MAILPMQRIRIWALREERKAILEWVQGWGGVEITALPPEEVSENNFTQQDTSAQVSQFERAMHQILSAMQVLDSVAPQKKGMLAMLNGRPSVDESVCRGMAQEASAVYKQCQDVLALDRDRNEEKAQIARLAQRRAALSSYMAFDAALSTQGTSRTAALLGTLPQPMSAEEVEALFADVEGITGVHVEVLETSREQTSVFFLCLKPELDKVEEILRARGFTRPPFALPQRTPEEELAHIARREEARSKTIAEIEEKIAAFAPSRKKWELLYDYYMMRKTKYEAIAYLGETNRTFLIEGWVPQRGVEKLEKGLASFTAHLELVEPREGETAPILFENNRVVSSFETVTEMYSMPGPEDVDPNPLFTPFYIVFFGMMLSDAAYGVVVSLVTGLLLLKGKLEGNLKKMVRMFFFCGLSTVFWGAMFGSWFGNIVNVVSSNFFGTEVAIAPLWFDPVKDPVTLLIFSLGLGVVHIFVGMGIKFVNLCRHGHWLDAIFDVGFWYLLLIGLILMLVPLGLGDIPMIMAAVGAVGLLLTQGRAKKNFFKKITGGLGALYNITGYLSDVLSYSRLLALGLATGVIATVFNTMGASFGSGILGALVLLIVFVIGHTINILINLLGAYVHTNRLQYVEFFGKFYEGGGRAFVPFKSSTKFNRMKRSE